MESSPPPTSFAEDVEFLRRRGQPLVLTSAQGGRVAVSPEYQARVMTSAVEAGGASLGWVNRKHVESGLTGTPFDNYGGEDRFWLGPEGGQFSVFFPPGAPFELAHWQTPHGFQEGTWQIASQTETFVTFRHGFRVENASGTQFDVGLERRIEVLDAASVSRAFGIALPPELKWVGFRSDNRLRNEGARAWSEQTGLISIWSLGMFVPADDTWVIAPFERSGPGERGEPHEPGARREPHEPGARGEPDEIVSSDYFGALPSSRLRVDEARGVVMFLADGRYRSKIGLSQSRARPVAGSYTRSERRLTIIRYSMPDGPRPYVNSKWEIQAEPFAGDLFNSYNHGTLTPGPLADVRFYELESSSPGAALGPGQTLNHEHLTVHFIGEEAVLDLIATRVLGVSLSLIGG